MSDALAQSYIDLQVLRLHNLRTLTRLGRGEEPGPESSWVKLMWTTMTQRLSETGLAVTGRNPTSSWPGRGPVSGSGAAPPFAGGTSEIQRDIIAGRILRLPR